MMVFSATILFKQAKVCASERTWSSDPFWEFMELVIVIGILEGTEMFCW
jgi:hypothetical protein